MKKIYTIVFLSLCSVVSLAQAGEWTWMKGSDMMGTAGTYGVKGTANAANNPPALYEPAQWTDLNGKFWLYGGEDTTGSFHDDLWMYDPSTNEWTWMFGNHGLDDPGNYGTMGVMSPANSPPSRGNCAASWVDNNGNLWFFGGVNPHFYYYCDLWEYNISAGEWTWVKGPNTPNQPGIYGTRTIANAANNPGSRHETSVTWTDNNNNLWFFGGVDSTNAGFNDVWKYSIGTNEWTYMKGSTIPGLLGTYGPKGVEGPAYTPGGRLVYSNWKDGSGNVWVFGGYDFTNNIFQSDMWRYNPATNNWTWMSGSKTGNVSAIYGAKCDTGSVNTPGGRFETRTSWTDQNGNFWLFGGASDDSFDVMNDVWDVLPC